MGPLLSLGQSACTHLTSESVVFIVIECDSEYTMPFWLHFIAFTLLRYVHVVTDVFQ